MVAKTKIRLALRLVYILVTGALVINTLCIVSNRTYQQYLSRNTVYSNGTSSTGSCNDCNLCVGVGGPASTSRPSMPDPNSEPNSINLQSMPTTMHRNPTFTSIEYFLPSRPSTLGPISSRNSLTRVGTELTSFNPLSSCPSGTYHYPSFNAINPTHTSCPAVFIIGARKGGTTSLYHYLSSHPQFEGVHLDNSPMSGETFHFSSRYNTETWSEYMAKFPNQYVMTGDASVGNLVNCKVPERIFESCGNFSKVVILLRNPVNRYTSNFRMRVNLMTRHHNNNTSISTSVKISIQQYIDTLMSHGVDLSAALGKQGGSSQWQKLRCLFGPSTNMVYEGIYYLHVMNWLCNYPLENILILNSEEFFERTADILKEVYQFLGMDTLSPSQREVITSFVYNKQARPALPNHVLQPMDRRKLNTVYSSFNEKIFKLLDWPNDRLSTWN